jgi:hypothetical protein
MSLSGNTDCDCCGMNISPMSSRGTLIVPFNDQVESRTVVLHLCPPCARAALSDLRSHDDNDL